MHDSAAQEFWLSNLGSASRFNDWVFAQFSDCLGESVLEIGCGIGNFTVLIAGSGRKVTAVDIHQPFVEAARSRLSKYPNVSVLCADATREKWAQNFDSIVLLDVLEHIEDDVGFLRMLRAALRPGGRLILKVPAGPWLLNAMDRAIGHFRRYDRHTLATTIARADLTVEDQRYFNRVAILGWFLNGTVLGRITPPSDQIGWFERLIPVLRVLEDRIPVPLGLSLIARATVPVS